MLQSWHEGGGSRCGRSSQVRVEPALAGTGWDQTGGERRKEGARLLGSGQLVWGRVPETSVGLEVPEPSVGLFSPNSVTLSRWCKKAVGCQVWAQMAGPTWECAFESHSKDSGA